MKNSIYQDKSEQWEFEKKFCVDKYEIWKHEAFNLKSSAEIITNVTYDELNDIVPQKYITHGFFSSRVERMLWGFSFENLFKGKIIKELKEKENITEVPLKKIKSHNLIDLAEKANIILDTDEAFYLEVAQTCALWAGRYPLPIMKEHMPKKRKPLSSSEKLLQRITRLFKKVQENKKERIVEVDDILNQDMWGRERDVYSKLFDRVYKEI